MKRFVFVLVFVALAASVSAQCLPIPNGDTRALVLGVFEGKPFNQQTLEDAMPFLNRYGIQLTEPNAAGEKTKIGDPLSQKWTRVGFGEGHPVWIPQGDVYTLNPAICGTVTVPPVVVTPPPVIVPPVASVDLSAVLGRLDTIAALLAQQSADERAQMDAQTATLKAAIDEPAWFGKFFGNRYVQVILTGIGTWLGTKAAQ